MILKFAREGKEFEVDAGFPVLGVMAAAAGLGLANGVSFEITCEGQDAEAAFERLRQVFTTGHFEGSSFEPLGDLTNG